MKPLKRMVWSGRIWCIIPPARLPLTLILTALLGVSVSAYSATNIVTSLADTGPGSLREVIAASTTGDEVGFNVGGTVLLTSGELMIAKDLTIRGPGSETLAISGNHLSRVFRVTNGVAVAISDLSIINGRPAQVSEPGGGILNGGELTVSNCIICGNSSADGGSNGGSGGNGGGILNTGSLHLLNSSLVGNSTGRGLLQQTGSANGGSGGGLFNEGTCLVSGCRFESNSTGDGGDGVYGSYSGSGGGAGGDGGAIGSRTAIELVNSTLRDNHCGKGGKGGDSAMFSMEGGAGGKGGAIYADGELTMTGCTIASNTAGAGGEGGYSSSTWIAVGGLGGRGGGICGPFPAWSGALWITNCTFAYNRSGDGGYDLRSGSVAGSGGAVYACWSNHAIISCTIVSNSVGLGGSRDGVGGGICFDVLTSPVFLNVIVAKNDGPRYWLVDAGPDILGLVTSLGHNLVGATNGTGGFTMPGDMFGSRTVPLDPNVGPLGDHGGPTWTMALRPESPCIDAGTLVGTPATDQRGVPRPQGTAADIGAFEYQLPVAEITGCRYQPNSGFYISASAWPNRSYAVQVSTNLQHWSELTNVLSDGSGSIELLDCNPPASPLRAYRLKLLPP